MSTGEVPEFMKGDDQPGSVDDALPFYQLLERAGLIDPDGFPTEYNHNEHVVRNMMADEEGALVEEPIEEALGPPDLANDDPPHPRHPRGRNIAEGLRRLREEQERGE